MASPLVSVVMPVYNGQRYLRAALDSVSAQTFTDFEVIAVDDGSTDETPQILAQCGDSRVRVVRIPHRGLIAALNEGLLHAASPYVARMDADDISYPDRFAHQADFLESHPDVHVVTCWCDMLDEAGTIVGKRTEGVGDDMVLELAAGNRIVHGSVMLRRTALPPHPVYSKPPEDYWLWLQMVRAGRNFHCLPEVLYGFRTHGGRYSLTHADSQCAGIVQVQWPLLEECTAQRDSNSSTVRERLVRGWGGVAGAAYRAQDWSRANLARRRFLELAGSDWGESVQPAVAYGIEAMIWGGCPWPRAWGLRFRQWLAKPFALEAIRNLLLTLPPFRALCAWRRR